MHKQLHPIELTAPDLAPYRRGNTGIEYVTCFDSGRPGPHVVINALIHGNELCGAIAIDFLFRSGIRPRQGQLTLCLANIAAYKRFDPAHPGLSRFVDEDMNRLWSDEALDGPRQSTELTRARQLRPLFDRADYLLDLHSMHHATAPLMLCGATARGQALALTLGAPHWVVSDRGHATGRRLLDYHAFSTSSGQRTALLAECGQHGQQCSATFAIEIALRFLLRLAVIEPDPQALPLKLDHDDAAALIEITDAVVMTGNSFTFVRSFIGMEIIEHGGTVIAHDDQREIRTPYDRCILIMPSHRINRGQTAVRLGRFVTFGARP
ncbi:MAG: succinylglutamate desuccinylase/aspartoacylase family protein [Azospirillaceae bacterium]|nr:succinylglutamate desuccinylase/aspartoacylase family protein [Azospirillaceae bacterium]